MLFRSFIVAVFLFYSTVFSGQPVFAGCPSFSSLIHHGAYAVADVRGEIVSGCNIDTPFIPASIGLKLSK